MLKIRPADDDCELWRPLKSMIRAGESHARPIDMSRAEAIRLLARRRIGNHLLQSTIASPRELQGTFYLRPNQMGGGTHVANCGYIAAVQKQGRGVARQMRQLS